MDLSSIEAVKAKAARAKARRARTRREQFSSCSGCGRFGLVLKKSLCSECIRVNEIMERDMAQKKLSGGSSRGDKLPTVGKLFLLPKREAKTPDKPIESPKPQLEGRAPRPQDGEEV